MIKSIEKTNIYFHSVQYIALLSQPHKQGFPYYYIYTQLGCNIARYAVKAIDLEWLSPFSLAFKLEQGHVACVTLFLYIFPAMIMRADNVRPVTPAINMWCEVIYIMLLEYSSHAISISSVMGFQFLVFFFALFVIFIIFLLICKPLILGFFIIIVSIFFVFYIILPFIFLLLFSILIIILALIGLPLFFVLLK